MTPDTLLIISTSYPETDDGSEAAGSFVADLAEELARHLPVRVVAPGRLDGSVETSGDLTVRRFASTGLPLSLLSIRRPRHWSDIARTLWSLRKNALASNDDGRVAHTLALWALPSGWAAAALQSRDSVPYSVWVLGSDIWTLGQVPVVRDVLKRVIQGARHRYADGLQLASDATRISSAPFHFLPSSRRLSCPGVRSPRTQPPYVLLFLGRWHPNKGIDLLLEALVELGDETWKNIGELHIAGGGPLTDLVHEKVEGLRAAGRPMRLDGFLDRGAAAAAIAKADWVLIPSRIESIPVIFSDAMKLGRPVVATPVGDLGELVAAAPGCGILAKEVSSAGIRAAIERAVSEGPTRYEQGVTRAGLGFELDGVAVRIARETMSHNCSRMTSDD